MTFQTKDQTIEAQMLFIRQLEADLAAMREALEFIACPERPDGSYNRDRKACELLAEKALSSTSGKELLERLELQNIEICRLKAELADAQTVLKDVPRLIAKLEALGNSEVGR